MNDDNFQNFLDKAATFIMALSMVLTAFYVLYLCGI